MMVIIEKVFGNLSNWRKLPKYQLERRLDIFFSLYLTEVLKKKFDTEFYPKIIPEFPVRKGCLSGEKESNNSSVNIDYLAISKEKKNAIFLEFKTDMGSRNRNQDDYLKKAAETDLNILLDGILEISKVTKDKKKYGNLLLELSCLGLLNFETEKLRKILNQDRLWGWTEFLGKKGEKKIETSYKGLPPEIVYLQPGKNCENSEEIIIFQEVLDVVEAFEEGKNDKFSEEFAKLLREIIEEDGQILAKE